LLTAALIGLNIYSCFFCTYESDHVKSVLSQFQCKYLYIFQKKALPLDPTFKHFQRPFICIWHSVFILYKGRGARTVRLTVQQRRRFYDSVFSNWQKALQRFQEHSGSHRRVSHHYATQPVDAQLSSQRAMQQSEARDCPKIIFTSIQYLA